jgi:hypothetical protein
MPRFLRRSISRSASTLYSIATFKNSAFFRREVGLDGPDHAQRSSLGGTVSLKAARLLTADNRGSRRHTHIRSPSRTVTGR